MVERGKRLAGWSGRWGWWWLGRWAGGRVGGEHVGSAWWFTDSALSWCERTTRAAQAADREHFEWRLATLRMDEDVFRQELLNIGSERRAKLQQARCEREATDEVHRRHLREQFSELHGRYRRVRSLADDAHAVGGWMGSAGSSKLQALVRLMRENVSSGQKAVVFTRFGAEAVKFISTFLLQNGIGAITLKDKKIIGGNRCACSPLCAARSSPTPDPVEIFRTCSECRVLVLHADVSAAGLTLTCAQHVIFLDVLNSTALESQA